MEMVKPSTPSKLLFVCSGNSCRSPMAMIVAEKMEADRGKIIESDSAAGNFKNGKFVASQSPAVNAIRALEAVYGQTRLKEYTPKPLKKEDIEKADKVIFLGVEFRKNAEDAKKLFGDALDGKAMYYCTYVNKQDSKDKERHEVPDPLDGDNWPEYYGEEKPGYRQFSSYAKVLKSMIQDFYPALRDELFQDE
uniref:Phosphotyrosine protein phosphatase I domain-containing protein n=1 Tax=Amphimedon queenslandica TaxID=400682 RepID=A0A1X7VGK9_AMPQE